MDFEQALQELQQLYSTSSRVPGFGRKVMVDGDQFSSVISSLRTVMPADVQEAKEILSQKDSILNQAYLEGPADQGHGRGGSRRSDQGRAGGTPVQGR